MIESKNEANRKPFNADEINLIYQLGEQSKAETCAELTATTKRRKVTERDHSIRARLAETKEQAKEPTVAVRKQHKIERKGKAGRELRN